MHEYRVEIVKVVDGDTVDVDIDLGFGIWMKNERVRLFGIDTPESRTRDLEEKKYGLAAKQYLIDKLNAGTPILKTFKDSPYDESRQILEKMKTLNFSINMAFGKLDQLLRQIENKLNTEENGNKSTD